MCEVFIAHLESIFLGGEGGRLARTCIAEEIDPEDMCARFSSQTWRASFGRVVEEERGKRFSLRVESKVQTVTANLVFDRSSAEKLSVDDWSRLKGEETDAA